MALVPVLFLLLFLLLPFVAVVWLSRGVWAEEGEEEEGSSPGEAAAKEE